jgi:hypothetical protein
MLLTYDQKVVFARWLEQQIKSSEEILPQLEKTGMPAALLSKERAEQLACKVVLKMITTGEDQSIGGGV